MANAIALAARNISTWTPGGPKPPGSARPALGGRFTPTWSGAALSWSLAEAALWRRFRMSAADASGVVISRSAEASVIPNLTVLQFAHVKKTVFR